MSLNIIPLEVIKTVDPVLNLHSRRYYTAYDGGSECTFQQFTAQGLNTSNITVVCNPPNEHTVIDSLIWQKYVFNGKYFATNNSGVTKKIIEVDSLNRPLIDAPRQFPLAQCTATSQIQMNGTSFMTNLNQYFNGFIRLSNDIDAQDHLYSMTASQLDQDLKYETMFGTNRSPFAIYDDNVIQNSRASYVGFEIVSNPDILNGFPGEATFKLTVWEPIFVSPFFFSQQGLAGIKTMTYTQIFGDLNRLMCRCPANGTATPPLALTGATYAVADMQLLFRYISPKLLDNVPKQLSYPFNDVLLSIKSDDASSKLNAGASRDYVMNSLNLEAVPRRVVVFCREIDNDIQGLANINKPDVFNNVINSISLSYSNRSGLLSSCTKNDLFQIYRRNGGDMSFTQWTSKIGSVLPIDIGKDIGLSSLECAGLLANPQLGMKVNITNISDRAIAFSLYVCIIYEGSVSVINGNIVKQLAVLNSTDVVNSQLQGHERIAKIPQNYFGGQVFDILKLIRKGVQVGAPIVKKVADIAEQFGLGKKKKGAKIAGIIGGKHKGGKHKGGKMISREQLAEEMENDY
jgi:hypothetical protein